jgi:hypothetical protein
VVVMREGTVVPASAIPARAWGIGWDGRLQDDVSAEDPFGGTGVRLQIPAGRDIDIDDIREATGISQVVTFSDGWCWVDANARATPEEVHARWTGRLGAEGPPPLE